MYPWKAGIIAAAGPLPSTQLPYLPQVDAWAGALLHAGTAVAIRPSLSIYLQDGETTSYTNYGTPETSSGSGSQWAGGIGLGAFYFFKPKGRRGRFTIPRIAPKTAAEASSMTRPLPLPSPC